MSGSLFWSRTKIIQRTIVKSTNSFGLLTIIEAQVLRPVLGISNWPFLAKQCASRPPAVDSAQCEINKYLIELCNSSPASDPLEFWEQRMHVYPRLAPLAQDMISAPASQAFVERIFSVCGFLPKAAEIAWQSLWKCVYFCVLMLTLSRLLNRALNVVFTLSVLIGLVFTGSYQWSIHPSKFRAARPMRNENLLNSCNFTVPPRVFSRN